jgi:hypothetical protein
MESPSNFEGLFCFQTGGKSIENKDLNLLQDNKILIVFHCCYAYTDIAKNYI